MIEKESPPTIEKKSTAVPEREISRFYESLETVKKRIGEIKRKMSDRLSEEELEIYDAHISILEDPELIDKTVALISTQACSADFALQSVAKEYMELLGQLDDVYLSARAKDIDEVTGDVIKSLQGKLDRQIKLTTPAILVADQISTYLISTLDTQFINGIVTELGGATDHSSILYSAMGIPAVVGVVGALGSIVHADGILLDAEKGMITVDPDPETFETFQKRYQNHLLQEKENLESSHLPAKTLSGKQIKVFANIGDVKEAKEAQARGADGVGLLRTEFCFLDRTTLPTEEEQFEMYRAMLDELPGKEVVVRLIDIGSDKKVSYIEMEAEENPALGTRALRLGLKHYETLLKPQIRALLRLSSTYDIQLLFPMIASPQDLGQIKDALSRELTTLEKEGIRVNRSIPMGIMVEVPNVALSPESFVDEVDFFSFGTNDLAQYMMAADRTNPSVSDYIPAAVPGILKMIENVVEVAHSNRKWVGICGGLAADTNLTKTFLDMGIDELSMPAAVIPKMKAFIRTLE